MNEAGFTIGRFKVRSLMREAGLKSRQPDPSPYKKYGKARVDIPNLLDRQFDVPEPNKVWRGEISYIWAGDRWHRYRSSSPVRKKSRVKAIHRHYVSSPH